MNIVIPDNETRIFSGHQLENKVKFINIQDNNLDKSHVMVSVNVGSIFNPNEYQGLAHFLEHMLFLGSEKYPGEDSFEKFLNENGGSSNAYTDTFETVYYFSIFNDKLEKAIDMFSRFFIDPLFDQDSVDREINAIESEHSKNIQQDNWRFHHFIGLSSKKDSMINKFLTGNLYSLKKEGIRENMIDFYKKYYVSSNISVVTISSIKNEKIKEFITNSFSKIPMVKEKPTINLNKPFFEKKSQSFFIKSVSKKYSLNYYWEIPTFDKNYNFTHTPYIISNVISGDNEKSLKRFLINEGLIKYLFVEILPEGLLIVHFELSKIENWQKVDSYFRFYMNDMKNKDWQKICDYYKKKDEVLFNYSSKSDNEDLGFRLVTNLFYYNIEDVYIGDRVAKSIDLEQISDLFDNYLTLNKVNIVLSSNSENDLKNVKLGSKKTEPYYELEYFDADINILNEKSFDYEIITENPFLNIKPKLYEGKDDILIPRKVNINNSNIKAWFGNVFKFKESKIYAILCFKNSELVSSIENYMNLQILTYYINKKITEKFNLAYELGFYASISFNNDDSIVLIKIMGHNDKYKEYFNMVVDYIKNFKFENEDEVLVRTIIDSIHDGIINIQKKNPWEYNSYLQELNVNPKYYTIEKQIKVIDSIIVNDFKLEISKLKNIIFNESKFIPFFYGNVYSDYLFEDGISNYFETKEKDINKLNLLTDVNEVHPNLDEENNYLQFSYYIGKFLPMDNLLLLVLVLSMSQSFYDKIRTKQQFGYLVSCNRLTIQDHYYLVERVQSKRSLKEIENAINEFNESFLNSVSEEDYNKFVIAAKNILEEKENSTRELFSKYASEIIDGKFEFKREELLLKKIKDLTYEKFKKFFQDKILYAKPVKTIIRNQNE